MTEVRYVFAAAVAAIVVVALIASLTLRDGQVATTLSPTQSATAAPRGTITGRLGYPSDFIPQLNIWAVSVSDPRVFFFVSTPRYGSAPSVPPTTGPIPPYMLAVPAGTYYVFAVRNDLGPNVVGPGTVVYSQYTVKCQQASPAPTGPCQESHTPIPVTVRAGETVDRIDLTDWFCNLPPSSCPSPPGRPA